MVGGVTSLAMSPIPILVFFVLLSFFQKKVRESLTCFLLLRKEGGLKDVAPTVLKLMGIPQPEEMTGKPLF